MYITAKKICSCTESLLNQMLSHLGLSASQCYLLVYICRNHPEGTSATELHRELGLSMAAVSGSLKRLRQKGFLAIAINQTDERQKKIVPTSRLIGLVDELEQYIHKAANMLYGTVSDEEREMFSHLEEKMLCAVTDIPMKNADFITEHPVGVSGCSKNEKNNEGRQSW